MPKIIITEHQLVGLIRNSISSFIKEDIDYSEYKTAIIMVRYQGKALILRRGSTAPWMPNKWSFPGGGVDGSETYIQAIKRECSEEIGIVPNSIRLLKEIKTPDIGILVLFEGVVDTDDITLDYENDKFLFIDKNEIDNFEYVPYVKELLKIYFK